MSDTVVYELHVRGFTRSPTSSASTHPGTFAGIIEKIPYLKELGVTAVELLPVFEFDEREVRGMNRPTAPTSQLLGLRPVGALRAAVGYCVSPEEGSQITEFRDIVKALHRAGIEVILDVVFNHTGEGNHMGRRSASGASATTLTTSSTRPTGSSTWTTPACGNTVNAQSPDRREVHSRLPALLGRGDARRRLPLRRGVDARARRATARRLRSHRSSGASSCPTGSRARR